MKRILTYGMLVMLLIAPSAMGQAEPYLDVSSWDDAGDVQSWYGGSGSVTLSNPSNYLQMRFAQQSFPESASCIARKDVTGVMLDKLTFAFQADDYLPSALRLYVHSTSGRAWYVNLSTPALLGQQLVYEVQVDYGAGWTIGPAGTEAQFLADMSSVDWVGVYVRRNGSLAAQRYRIDDFVMEGVIAQPDKDGDFMADTWENANQLDPGNPDDASQDDDGDGMSNYAEYRAGTNPQDPDSVFALDIEVPALEEPGSGVMIRWGSTANRTYSILRTTDLMLPFSPLYTGIPATPPVNVYQDTTATGTGPYFYKVTVEE